jgi:glycosyltransferase involved in cell wall biosynthesis
MSQKISIITPTFNSEKDIESCILSVANQSYENKEHFIVDGLSSDGTMEIVKKYMPKYNHIRWISEKDEGIYDAMNKGIDLASGEWVYFLGSDDVFFSDDVLEKIFNKEENISQDVLYGNVKWGETDRIYDGKFSLLKLLNNNICHQAIFFKRSIFNELGKFEIKYKVLADWYFNVIWFSNDLIKRKYLDVIIAKYNIYGRSSKNKDLELMKDKELIIAKYFPKEFIEMNNENIELKKVIKKKDEYIDSLKDALTKKDEYAGILLGEIDLLKKSFWNKLFKIKNKI